MKNILVISASPRKGGNSDVLCDEFIKGAQQAGHKAEKIFLRLQKCLWQIFRNFSRTFSSAAEMK